MFTLKNLWRNTPFGAHRQTMPTARRNGARTGGVRHIIFASSLLASGLAAGSSLAQDDDHNFREGRPTVNTVEGPVRGYTRNGVNVFLGIPYAAPPVGDLRWQPPQPVRRWDDALDATHFGNHCPQVSEFGVFAGSPSVNEHCLYLNVFTTGGGNFGQKKRLSSGFTAAETSMANSMTMMAASLRQAAQMAWPR